MDKKKRFLFATGTTGGHLFPIVSLADELKKKGHDINIVHSNSSIEKTVLAQFDFSCFALSVGRLRKGVGLCERIWTVLCLPFYMIRSMILILTVKPDIVMGVGGALCGPVLLSARLLGCYTVIWELNAVPGFTNKILSFFVHSIFICFESAKKFLPSKKCFIYSFPVRKDIWREGNQKREPDGYFHLLILGGSQGAHSINKAVLEMCYKEKLETWKIRHQTGTKDFESIQSIYSKKEHFECQPFFDNMGECYQWADVVISRAGAGTLAELSACSKAVIVIPLSSASDNHQFKNAMAFKQAVEVLQEKNLTGQKLFETIMSFQGKKKRQYEENIKKFYDFESVQKMQEHLLKSIKN